MECDVPRQDRQRKDTGKAFHFEPRGCFVIPVVLFALLASVMVFVGTRGFVDLSMTCSLNPCILHFLVAHHDEHPAVDDALRWC